MTRLFSIAALLLAVASYGVSNTASASPEQWLKGRYLEVECAQIFCGYLEANPRIYLTSVNPDPLPAVEPGADQEVTVTWSTRHGLKTLFQLCITAGPGAQPDTSDGCVALTGSNITSITKLYVHFEETVTLPGSLRKPSADFYIRSTPALTLFGRPPEQKVSNQRTFVWPLPLPNLNIEGADTDYYASNGQVIANADVTNASDTDLTNIEVQMTVFVCDGNIPPSLRPGSTRSDDILCFEQAGNYLSHFDAGTVTIPYLQARATDTAAINITSMLPASPDNLMITLVAIVDPNNQIAESNESVASNLDDGTDYVHR
ncbi:MAG: hypothetical protein AAGG11_20075 [Pseudomonadota bacterium]